MEFRKSKHLKAGTRDFLIINAKPKTMKTFAISIPKPCHENWNNMTPDAKGAFCGSCQKSVYDFSDKTDEEIISVFEKEEKGKVCGRFTSTQLTQPVVSFGNPSSTNRLAVFLYALLLAFGATLFSGAEAFGQQTVKGEMKVKVMGKMAVRPIEPATATANDTTIQVKQIPPTVCGTKTIVDNRIMTMGQVVAQPVIIKEPDPIIKTMGDTVIEDISVNTVIETPPTKIIEETIIEEGPINIDIDTLAIIDETTAIDTLEPIVTIPAVSYIAGGVSYTEITKVATLDEIPPTEEKTEDKPLVDSETNTILPIEESTEVTATTVSELVITPPADLEIKVSPNPSTGNIILSYNLEKSMSVRIELFDITGKNVKTLTQTGNQYAGKYNVSYNIAELPIGVYTAVLLANDRVATAKIILLK